MAEPLVECPLCSATVGLRQLPSGAWVLRQHREKLAPVGEVSTCANSGQVYLGRMPP